jgi:hypothetical protein
MAGAQTVGDIMLFANKLPENRNPNSARRVEVRGPKATSEEENRIARSLRTCDGDGGPR